jgi:hypothetical protein
MSSVLPLEIIALIIDIVGENEDTNLLKDLALVSHSFHQICSKHIFATVELHDAVPMCQVASSKKGFVKLLTGSPDVVKYIRKLTYKVGYDYQSYASQFPPTHPSLNTDDHLLSPILPNFLRTISRLNCLTINALKLDWNTLESSMTSMFLHLMNLSTINHIDLSFIQNFPLSGLTPSVNMHRLDISYLSRANPLEEDGSPEIVVQSEMMPKIREFHTSDSCLLTTTLLHAKMEDGRPAFNIMGLRRLSMSFTRFEDERNIRYLLQNAKLLEKLHLSVRLGRSLVELHDILSPSARTLKVLDLTVSLYDDSVPVPLLLAGLCEELEAMAGHNMLEALSLDVNVDGYETEVFIGSIIQDVEKVLVKPGWSALRQVSFKVSIACCLVSREDSAVLSEALQSLPDTYLIQLSKLESVAFNFSAYVVKCAFEPD